jgi:hypothetical protein
MGKLRQSSQPYFLDVIALGVATLFGWCRRAV